MSMSYKVSTKSRVKESGIFQGSKNTRSYVNVHGYQINMPHKTKWESLIIYINPYFFFIKYVITLKVNEYHYHFLPFPTSLGTRN